MRTITSFLAVVTIVAVTSAVGALAYVKDHQAAHATVSDTVTVSSSAANNTVGLGNTFTVTIAITSSGTPHKGVNWEVAYATNVSFVSHTNSCSGEPGAITYPWAAYSTPFEAELTPALKTLGLGAGCVSLDNSYPGSTQLGRFVTVVLRCDANGRSPVILRPRTATSNPLNDAAFGMSLFGPNGAFPTSLEPQYASPYGQQAGFDVICGVDVPVPTPTPDPTPTPTPVPPPAPFVVNATGDTSDATPGDGICNDGTGGCTLRAAIQESNALAGTGSIHFGISGCCGVHVISPASPLPPMTDAVTIDGTTDPEGIRLSGAFAGPGDGLIITAGGSTVRGLQVVSWSGSGIRIVGPSGLNTVDSNLVGTDGAASLPNGGGITIENSPTNTIGPGNLVSGNEGDGVSITGAGATGNVLRGNRIGVDGTGLGSLPNGGNGVSIGGTGGNSVGLFRGYGNIGSGTCPDPCNVIAHNTGAGVYMSTSGNTVRSNELHDNGGLGIDLAPPGLTPIVDGALTFAMNEVGHTMIGGYVRGVPPTSSIPVDIFWSPTCDPSGFGEGETWMAHGPVQSDSDGSFSAASWLVFADPAPVGSFITGSGTLPDGTAQEFSNCVPVLADSDGDGIQDAVDVEPLVPSTSFSDGTTFGTIMDPASKLVGVVDLPFPDGVVIGTASPPGPMVPPSIVSVCGIANVELAGQSSTIQKCGSVTTEVLIGEVTAKFGGISASLPAQTKSTVSQVSSDVYLVTNDATSKTAITFGGNVVSPGASQAITSAVAVGGIAEQPDITALPSAAPSGHNYRVHILGAVVVFLAVAGAVGWRGRRLARGG